jgi:hypothetical protein
MAKATFTLTANNKAIDMHVNDGVIHGIDSGDEYLVIDHIIRMSVDDDFLSITLVDDAKLTIPYDQVETVGAVTHSPNFTNTTDLKNAFKTILGW